MVCLKYDREVLRILLLVRISCLRRHDKRVRATHWGFQVTGQRVRICVCKRGGEGACVYAFVCTRATERVHLCVLSSFGIRRLSYVKMWCLIITSTNIGQHEGKCLDIKNYYGRERPLNLRCKDITSTLYDKACDTCTCNHARCPRLRNNMTVPKDKNSYGAKKIAQTTENDKWIPDHRKPNHALHLSMTATTCISG